MSARVVILDEHPGYEIYDDGRIRGPRGKFLNAMLRPSGYRFIRRWNGTKLINLSVHGLVCTAFHGPRPTPIHQVRHLNGVKTDNRAENLVWGTPKENQRDRVAHGTSPQGEGNGQAKATWDLVSAIRARHAEHVTQRALVAEFGLSLTQIGRIVRWENWKYPPQTAEQQQLSA